MKPFLKWAGNKYQIIQHIQQVLPAGKRLIEPFIGAGAVFLNSNYPTYLLADANPDLIHLYQYLQREGHSFIDDCRQFFCVENNTEKKYYQLRSVFNETEDLRLKAMLFLYFNKHSFNGLCRYNNKGKFNAHLGRYRKPYFPEKEMYNFHQQAQRAIFQTADFLTTMQAAENGDVVYCDPPYAPLSKTANFAGYTMRGFDEAQQLQLVAAAEALAAHGVCVIISNHDTEFTRKVYVNAKILQFDVQRFISCQGSKRVKAPELLAIFS